MDAVEGEKVVGGGATASSSSSSFSLLLLLSVSKAKVMDSNSCCAREAISKSISVVLVSDCGWVVSS
ncbi:hypothetical protein FRACYDRAFT_271992 [Fragilariopsis cylindrus CCMP1102]|uniref:Uncharacterized protein n=1 Tax=Fragilariopsis cylindrus CCMP1102 TaxID=635003 RepID=A0A1E7EN61_9STRA|nr:hypothetical protein FRACYDRAFT_271992 [Fragilariopsis cylindrus CCMP1102]|eukprot:OEU07370.1 hypothetical protein FRACYDRAFT_271992 [Fragilariopsis cylindrus CCMP1102]